MNKKVNGNKLIYQESQLLANESDQHVISEKKKKKPIRADVALHIVTTLKSCKYDIFQPMMVMMIMIKKNNHPTIIQ